jgi:cob(I)alamin adenosyltransferase
MADIYTKLGDDGTTGLLFGGRVSKADALIDAIGTLDEAVAALALARASAPDEELAQHILEVQRGLFVAGADLAANPRARARLVPGVSLVTDKMLSRVEELIDLSVAKRPLRPVFLVPGANLASASLEVGRTVVRRAERRLVACQREERVPNPWILPYLNRVSDLIYVLARRAAGDDEEPVSHEAVDLP